MADSALSQQQRRRTRRRWTGLVLCAVSLASISANEQRSEPAKPAPKPGGAVNQGQLIRVPLPITGNVDNRVKGIVQRAVLQFDQQRAEGRRPVLILEITPGQSEFGQGSDFTRALNLARFLSSQQMAGVKTVAYIPRSIKGHAVLVAMACEEIVMAGDAELGEAGVDEPAEQPIEPAVLSGYKQIAERRRTIPVEVALGMLDKNQEVLKVETEVSVEYVLRSDLEDLRQRRAILSEEVLIRRGELGRFTGREARDLSFVSYLAADRQAVASALQLPPTAIQEDPSLGGDWEPVQIRLDGRVDARSVTRLQSMIKDQMRAGEVNFICLFLDSPGGSLAYSIDMANFLAGLDRSEVRTVAYVPNEAKADAALIAAACDHLVMHPRAVLGGQGPEPLDPQDVKAAQVPIRESIAKSKMRSWSVIAALIDPELEVHRYRNNKTGVVAYFSKEELDEQDEPGQWTKGQEVTVAAVPLELDGEEAKQLGLAWEVVDTFDELKQLYGLENDPRLVEPNWADYLVEVLARPEVAFLLLVIGGAAVYLELQMPGIGVGGFIATVCFLLFFWAKFLDNTAGWLEVMLFMGGLACLLLEIFVLPGFGIFGLGGGLLIIISLILASQTFVLPRNATELTEFRNSVLVVGGAMVGIAGGAFLLRRFLPHTPLFNRIMLPPPVADDPFVVSKPDRGSDFQHLLGQSGRATTQLIPSGKARFGDQVVDVIADGEVIDRGAKVVVVEVRGNRIVVQSASET